MERNYVTREEFSLLKDDLSETKVRVAVAEANIKDMKEDISTIKNNTTWILRLILGAIALALLGTVLTGGAL